MNFVIVCACAVGVFCFKVAHPQFSFTFKVPFLNFWKIYSFIVCTDAFVQGRRVPLGIVFSTCEIPNFYRLRMRNCSLSTSVEVFFVTVRACAFVIRLRVTYFMIAAYILLLFAHAQLSKAAESPGETFYIYFVIFRTCTVTFELWGSSFSSPILQVALTQFLCSFFMIAEYILFLFAPAQLSWAAESPRGIVFPFAESATWRE